MLKLGMNPWKTIWTTPRKTIRTLADFSPKVGFYYLASTFFLDAFFFFNSYLHIALSYKLAITILMAAILSPVLGAVWFYLFSWVALWIGKLFQGKATAAQLSCAFAWSKAPLLINLLMWLCFVAFSPSLIFLEQLKSFTIFFMYLILAIGAFWSLILAVIGFSEVEQISVIKAFFLLVIIYFLFAGVITGGFFIVKLFFKF